MGISFFSTKKWKTICFPFLKISWYMMRLLTVSPWVIARSQKSFQPSALAEELIFLTFN